MDHDTDRTDLKPSGSTLSLSRLNKAQKIPKSRTAASPHGHILGCGQSKGKIQVIGFGDGVQEKDHFIQDLDSKAIPHTPRTQRPV